MAASRLLHPLRRALTGVAFLLSTAGLAAHAEPATVTFAPTQTVLHMIAAEDAAHALADQRPAAVDETSVAETALLSYCENGVPQRTAATKFFMSQLVSPGLRILLNPIAARVHEELAKYSSLAVATASVDFYRGNDAGGTSHRLDSKYTCVRFTRYTPSDSGPGDVAVDFVAGIRLDAQRDALVLRPLRLFIAKAGARSATGHYGVAIELRADAVWRDEFAGHQGPVFQQTIANEKIDLEAKSALKYYPIEAAGGVRVPILPVSYGIDRSQDFGRAVFAVSVAEVGAPPATLTLLAELLPSSPDSLAKLVVLAALSAAKFP